MQRTRVGALAAFLAALVALAVEPVAAQSINKELIDSLNFKLLYVAIPITLLVEVILIYTVWSYRDNDDPKPTQENRRLEITWTVATAIILLFVGLAAFVVLGSPYISPTQANVVGTEQPATAGNGTGIEASVVDEDLPGAIAPPESANATEIDVRAFQWGWNFTYAEEGVSSGNTLALPANETVYLHIHSDEVLHAVHVPALGLKQDAFPGHYNTILTNATETGTYQLYCAEFCGAGHSAMLANVTVMEQNAYQNWLDEQGGGSASGDNASEAASGNASNATNPAETLPDKENSSSSNGSSTTATGSAARRVVG
jgi:cytochrome c oxidase subunit 2